MPPTAAANDFFSVDYFEARRRFRAAAQAAGARLESLPLPDLRGPSGEDLSIDVAVIGADRPARAVLHCAGLHGVEGFPGSAIQLAALSDPGGLPQPPADGALVLAHALNPWGMAWRRRVNENNVDLNRNFLPPGEPYSGSPPVYPRVNAWLNPPSPPGFDFYLFKVAAMVALHGFGPMKQAIAGGQYDFPKGLFYGGAALQPAARLHQDWLRANLASARRVVVIDVHTGLGASGVDVMLVDAPPASAAGRTLAAAFPRVQCLDPDAVRHGVAYVVRGGHHVGVETALPQNEVLFVTQEFGTLPPVRMLYAMREENRLQHFGGTHARRPDHPVRLRLLKAFSPASADWRETVVRAGRERLAQAARLAFAEG